MVAKKNNRQEVLEQAFTELRAWRQKYSEYHELAAIFEVIDKNYSYILGPGEPLPESEVTRLPGALGEPFPSQKNCEPVDGEQELSNLKKESDANSFVPAPTFDPDSSPSETAVQEPENCSAEPETPVIERAHQNVSCHDCRKLNPSSEEPGKGTCAKFSKPFTIGKEVVCSYFEPKDSAETSGPNQGVPEEMEDGQMVNAVN